MRSILRMRCLNGWTPVLSGLVVLFGVVLSCCFAQDGTRNKDINIVLAEKINSVPPEKLTNIKPSEWFVFLVAVNYYEPTIQQVTFTESDVAALRTAFLQLGVREQNIVIMKTQPVLGVTGPNDVPYKAILEKRYESFLKKLPEDALVFVYLSGHGFMSTATSKTYFAPFDFDPKKPLETSIAIEDLLAQLKESK